MSATIQHEGKEFVVVEYYGPDEMTAYRESVEGHIELYTKVPDFEPRVDLINVKLVKKVLEWRAITEEVERDDRQVTWNWRHNRDIEQGAAG
ncbi:hypothetical protein [Paenibacillus chitinolyticus]